jgi:hypothetical protein
MEFITDPRFPDIVLPFQPIDNGLADITERSNIVGINSELDHFILLLHLAVLLLILVYFD